MGFGAIYPIPARQPEPDLFDNLHPGCIENPGGDFRDGEVRGMWEDRRRNRLEMKMRMAEQNE